MANSITQLPLEMWEQMRPVFSRDFPNEAVVAIHGDKWKQLDNVSKKPAYSFALKPADAVWLHNHPPDLLLHSHPSPPASAEPSDKDTEQQLSTGWNWGIVAVTGNLQGQVYNVAYPECWGDGIALAPLTGRTYLWGIRDCWTLCRDWYTLEGYRVANVSRARKPDAYPVTDWRNDQIGNAPKMLGFKDVKRHDRQRGDCALMMFKSASRYNHCAIYLGEGKYLHQLENQTSCEWIPHNEEALIERFNIKYVRPPAKPTP